MRAPRSRQDPARRPASCPEGRPRHPGGSRASGSSAPGSRGGRAGSALRMRCRPRPAPWSSDRLCPPSQLLLRSRRSPILGRDTARGPNWAVLERPVSRSQGVYISDGAYTDERRPGMGKIVISENISVDGVVQDPTGEEGFKHGGWFLQVEDKDREEWGKLEYQEALGTEALLLGRRSYEYFASGWSSRPGDWADRLRSLPKYVASSTPLSGPDWKNATVLGGNLANEV